MRVSFGEFELDTTTFELRRNGDTVPLEPQVFDVLAYLVEHRDRLVPKEELLDEVWGDRFVSESALTTRVKHARQALGDDGRSQRYIRTVHGRGYRFVTDAVDLLDVDAVLEPSVGRRTGAPPNGGNGSTTAGHNLPAERTPLFGRLADIGHVTGLLGRHRLVCLLGMGGIGKTRLACAIGYRVVERFPDGIWYVDLVPVSDERSVHTAIAHAAGLALSTSETLAELARTVATRNALFVLDNCEHVRDEVAATVDHLLERSTGPRFLVTSREPLELPDECRVHVDVLPVDDFDDAPGPAVELFRASAERFAAPLHPDDEPTVRRICRHLDGLPLAIELAAAQLRLLTPAEMATRLDQRFELLRTRPLPGRERHGNLMSVLETTWALLDPAEQDFLGRLAAFPGPFQLVDVEQLTCDLPPGAAASALGRLEDHSLVVRASGSDGGFRLLETVRLFAGQRAPAGTHAARHAQWCLEQVGDDVEAHVDDLSLALWCTRHYDDLRTAEAHLLADGRPRDAVLLVAGSGLALHYDPGARAAALLRRIDTQLGVTDRAELRARLHFAGTMAGMATRSPDAIARHGRDGLTAAQRTEDEVLVALALVFASWSTVLDDPHLALGMVDRARDLVRTGANRGVVDLAESYRAFHLARLRRYDDAVAQADEVIARASALDDLGQAAIVAVLARCACCALSEPAQALRWVDTMLTRLSPTDTMWANQVFACVIHASAGNVVEAAALTAAAQARVRKAGGESLPDLLVPAAVLAHRLGDDERAARWVRAVRDAGRPTQSFHITCVYRRLRDIVGLAPSTAVTERSLDAIGEDALAWMQEMARAETGVTPPA